MKTIFTSLFFIIFLHIASFAQQDAPQNDSPSPEIPKVSAVPKELYAQSASFFKILLLNDVTDAYQVLLQNSPIRDKKEQFERLINQTKHAFNLYGNAKGYERVDEEYVTESLMRLRYITIHDDLPLRWVLTYYKSPRRGWIIINMKFDDEADYFFKEE